MKKTIPMRKGFKHRIFLGILIISCIYFHFVPLTATGAEQERKSDPDYIFYKGNANYEEGKYNEAIQEYLKLADLGMESGNMYYNIGNSYFKKGDLGKALLNYERAERLIPRDSDLQSNHGFTLSLIKQNVTAKPLPWFKRPFSLFSTLTVNEMTILLSTVFVLSVIFLIVRMIVPAAGKYMVYLSSVSLLLFILIFVSLSTRISVIEKESIVTAVNSLAKFEPIDDATTHFTLHEGMKVYLLHSKGEWSKVKRPDGKIGWVKTHDIEKI